MKDYRLAKIAYEGYRTSAGNRSLVSGERLPSWGDLSLAIQNAWFAAAAAVLEDLDPSW